MRSKIVIEINFNQKNTQFQLINTKCYYYIRNQISKQNFRLIYTQLNLNQVVCI